MRLLNVIPAVLLWTALAGATAAPMPRAKRVFDGNCGVPVKSPEDAMAKADFVIEGTVVAAFFVNDASAHLEVAIDGAKVIRERQASSKNRRAVMLVPGPCFAPGLHPFTDSGSVSVEGKRMRFFGNEHELSPRLRFFYMQAADLPMPVAPAAGAPWNAVNVTSIRHAAEVNRPVGGGWHRARSTEGRFSVELPAPYIDEIQVEDGSPSYILRAVDGKGSIFMLRFEPSRKSPLVAAGFDVSMADAGTVKSVFRGLPAVQFRDVLAQARVTVLHTKLIRVPGGIYTFWVLTARANETRSAPARERFFASIGFE
jgi:hypothetical protein